MEQRRRTEPDGKSVGFEPDREVLSTNGQACRRWCRQALHGRWVTQGATTEQQVKTEDIRTKQKSLLLSFRFLPNKQTTLYNLDIVSQL
mmetsp:Transcript_58412/g.142863  ORF Transcript_58412/g.142863 Transcript_58412/m.142863 type:complete len:89 (+) Transcript_58412:889-1155(+)